MKKMTNGEEFREVFTYENFKHLIVKNREMDQEIIELKSNQEELKRDQEEFRDFMN